MFKTSDSTGKLDAAMAKAQSEIQAAVKDKVNPAFRSKYADLSAVWEACREALTKNGISVTQWPVHSDDNRLHLVTRLACQGEWVMAEMSIPAAKQDAHGYGSATTYAKRFALTAAIGVVADEDDDGNEASKPANHDAPRQQPPKPQSVEQTDSEKADAWIRSAKDVIGGFSDRIMLTAWQKSNSKLMKSLAEKFPNKHDDFAAWLDDKFNTLPAGKAA
jgi:hypothetical protein